MSHIGLHGTQNTHKETNGTGRLPVVIASAGSRPATHGPTEENPWTSPATTTTRLALIVLGEEV